MSGESAPLDVDSSSGEEAGEGRGLQGLVQASPVGEKHDRGSAGAGLGAGCRPRFSELRQLFLAPGYK